MKRLMTSLRNDTYRSYIFKRFNPLIIRRRLRVTSINDDIVVFFRGKFIRRTNSCVAIIESDRLVFYNDSVIAW